jgi:hypothetical protein
MKLSDRDIRKAAGLKRKVPIAFWLWGGVALLLGVNFSVLLLDKPDGELTPVHAKVLGVERGRLPGQEAVSAQLDNGHRISYVAHRAVHPGEDVIVDRRRSVLLKRDTYLEHH